MNKLQNVPVRSSESEQKSTHVVINDECSLNIDLPSILLLVMDWKTPFPAVNELHIVCLSREKRKARAWIYPVVSVNESS